MHISFEKRATSIPTSYNAGGSDQGTRYIIGFSVAVPLALLVALLLWWWRRRKIGKGILPGRRRKAAEGGCGCFGRYLGGWKTKNRNHRKKRTLADVKREQAAAEETRRGNAEKNVPADARHEEQEKQ